MAVGDSPVSGFDATVEGSAEGVREFIDGNVDKRVAKLTATAGCLPEMCAAWQDWTGAFIRTIPPTAYSTAVSDCLRLLRWIRFHADLTPEQRDAVEGQRSRLIAEQRVRRDRTAYLEFSRLYREAQKQENPWDEDSELQLNPSCTPALFRTRHFLDEHAGLPARVVSYAVDGAVHTTTLEEIAAWIVGALWPGSRVSVERLLAQASDECGGAAAPDVLEALEELVQSGIAAPRAGSSVEGR